MIESVIDKIKIGSEEINCLRFRNSIEFNGEVHLHGICIPQIIDLFPLRTKNNKLSKIPRSKASPIIKKIIEDKIFTVKGKTPFCGNEIDIFLLKDFKELVRIFVKRGHSEAIMFWKKAFLDNPVCSETEKQTISLLSTEEKDSNKKVAVTTVVENVRGLNSQKNLIYLKRIQQIQDEDDVNLQQSLNFDEKDKSFLEKPTAIEDRNEENISVFNADLALNLLNAEDDYPVDFDLAWKWIGWSKKQDAKNVLLNNFELDIDFLRKGVKSPSGGRPSELILLTIDCFKSLSMIAGTSMGKEIRKYFLECEKILKNKNKIEKKNNCSVSNLDPLDALISGLQELKALKLDHELLKQKLELETKRSEELRNLVEQHNSELERIHKPHGDYYSVMGFLRIKGFNNISIKEASRIGKIATAKCEALGIEKEFVTDPRFGLVGLYPDSILEQCI